MAWSTITDTVLQVGKPIRALTLRLLRDNITALANGDSGAPRIKNAAYDTGSITGDKVAAGTIAGDRIAPYTIWYDRIAADSIGAFHLRLDTPERDWVLGRIAGLGAGAVGSYVLADFPSGVSPITYGNTYAGSGLRPASVSTTGSSVTGAQSGFPLSGTWRALGNQTVAGTGGISLFVRVV